MADLTGFKRDNEGLYIEKDPDANIQYGLDFTDYLNSGDSLSTATVTIETISGDTAPLAFPTNAVTDVNIAGALVSIRLEGGSTPNIYTIKCTITTSDGDTDSRSFRIVCKERLL